MGQLPLVNGRVTRATTDFRRVESTVSSTGRTLHLNWSFQSITDGAPALIDWLCAKGCDDLRYDLRLGADLDSGEEE